MKKRTLILGISSLVVALVLFLLNQNVYEDVILGVRVTVYATWFFVLLGGLLIVRAFVGLRTA